MLEYYHDGTQDLIRVIKVQILISLCVTGRISEIYQYDLADKVSFMKSGSASTCYASCDFEIQTDRISGIMRQFSFVYMHIFILFFGPDIKQTKVPSCNS